MNLSQIKREIKTNDDEYNFLLEGDNLHSLYLLEKTHKGKIDVIYIDIRTTKFIQIKGNFNKKTYK